jgi:hypothetical protein
MKTRNNFFRGWNKVFVAALVLLAAPATRAAAPVEYNRDVRPILSENCFACHGPDSAARKASLRLDRRDDAVKAGALVPGKPDESEMIRRILSTDPKESMPPRKTKKSLTSAQKDLLQRWVASGAEYQAHWSFIAPKRPALPAVKNAGWVRNPIDAFILHKLEEQGLQPAAEADRRTLARRLSLDLTGLPPAPAEVEKFVHDIQPDAYEKYVDRLLESAHWGEHRGRYWLDAARYADTHGIHFDNFREMWTYRDWVINAFNRNLPFDQFTIEQLAGDLLPNATIEQRIATGFNRCNITTNEGGAINEEYLVLYTRDRTETTSAVWMGLTANCTVCHDHKFDPLSQKEFYAMAAFFNNTTQQAMDGNIPDTPPILKVPRPQDRKRWSALGKELAQASKKVEDHKKAAAANFDKWLASVKPEHLAGKVPEGNLVLKAPLNEGTGNQVKVIVGGQVREVTLGQSIGWDAGKLSPKAYKVEPGTLQLADAGDLEKDHGFSYGAWVKIGNLNQSGAFFARMEERADYRGWDLWLEGGKVGCHLVHSWPGDALKVATRASLKPNRWTHVFATYDASSKASGVAIYFDGVRQETETQADALKETIRTQVPLKIGQRNDGQRVDGLILQDLRLYGRTLASAEVAQLANNTRIASLVAIPSDKRTAAQRKDLFDWWLNDQDPIYQELNGRLAKLRHEEETLRAQGTVAHIMQERPEAPMAYVLFRGEYDKRRDPVKAGTPKALPPMSPELPLNRLGFARWLLQPEHPLTARVTVNRFWQEVFGTGIVRTAGDFGTQGELPSHPELLDWLAVEFRESGWDVKKFFKMIVTSSTYRQAATATREKLEKDPQNRLLSRGPRFRMDAEMIRDYSLATSGLLSPKIGGPSVKPYQPEGVWEAVAIIGSNTRDYQADSGPSLYRRSMYTFWKRSAPPASMDILNAPNRETCTVRRDRTNTPLQALVTLNDPQFVEAARYLAQTALKEGKASCDAAADVMAQRLLARPFREEEKKVVRASLDELLAYYKAHPEDAKKLIMVGQAKPEPSLDAGNLAAWTMLANELINLDEVLNK